MPCKGEEELLQNFTFEAEKAENFYRLSTFSGFKSW